MKSLRCVAVFVSLFVVIVRLEAQLPIKIGVVGGFNIANASTDGYPEELTVKTKPRVVFGAGAVFELRLDDMISVQLEPRFMQKGAEADITYSAFGFTDEGTAIFKSTYIEVPLTGKLTVDAGMIKLYGIAGPSLNILLSAEQETEFGGNKETTDVKNELESLEFGVDFGAGLILQIDEKIALFGDARVSLGLNNINKQNDPDDKTTWKSQDIKFLGGIMLAL